MVAGHDALAVLRAAAEHIGGDTRIVGDVVCPATSQDD